MSGVKLDQAYLSFFQGTWSIGMNGFAMVIPAWNHHHEIFFNRLTIDWFFNGLEWVQWIATLYPKDIF